MSEIYDDRDFYRPIVTPYDLEMALNSNATHSEFTYSYNAILSSSGSIQEESDEEKTDVSLLTGKLRTNEYKEETEGFTGAVALKAEGAVAIDTGYGAGFLAGRSWRGLEQNLGQGEVKIVEEGLSGLAGGIYD